MTIKSVKYTVRHVGEKQYEYDEITIEADTLLEAMEAASRVQRRNSGNVTMPANPIANAQFVPPVPAAVPYQQTAVPAYDADDIPFGNMSDLPRIAQQQTQQPVNQFSQMNRGNSGWVVDCPWNNKAVQADLKAAGYRFQSKKEGGDNGWHGTTPPPASAQPFLRH